ncbi:hypothetical protein [Sagittula salina]|uniref:Uncharacterized protein n=1 Tax=Sagittula salina TaxID=2820268 RepID=A0A940ML90_9RHOB|nr:hypothetical protein [Sagittula salina]MBP0483880.1 hypothetical protein [Sagittula salina]
MIRALEAAAEVLSSDSQDLKELAAKAAATSGIPAERILMNIDLTGINLSGKQIDYLTDRGAQYHAAHITVEQRVKFQKGDRELRTRQRRRKIRSIRVELILDFVETFECQNTPLGELKRTPFPEAPLLKDILLSPLRRDYPADKPLDERYTQRVLVRLIRFAEEDNFDFFLELFGLLGDLQCEIGQVTFRLIVDDYFQRFGDAVGDLIGKLQPSVALDAQWIYVDPIDKPLNGGGEHKNDRARDVLFSSILRRAEQINKHRAIHAGAIEDVLDHLDDPLQKLDFIETVEFNCSADEAERIALRIIKADWPASRTRQVLEAKVPTKVRSALFRQIMHQGSVERTLEMLRWLNNNRGAVGALSLDDALARINSFAPLFDFASDVHMDLSVNQINVLRQALDRTAKDSAQRAKVRRLLSD